MSNSNLIMRNLNIWFADSCEIVNSVRVPAFNIGSSKIKCALFSPEILLLTLHKLIEHTRLVYEAPFDYMWPKWSFDHAYFECRCHIMIQDMFHHCFVILLLCVYG